MQPIEGTFVHVHVYVLLVIIKYMYTEENVRKCLREDMTICSCSVHYAWPTQYCVDVHVQQQPALSCISTYI